MMYISNKNSASVSMKFKACWKIESKNIRWPHPTECKCKKFRGLWANHSRLAEGSGQTGSMGRGQLYEVQQGQMPGPTLGSLQPHANYRLGEEWLESCPVEKDLECWLTAGWTWANSVPRWPRRPAASWLVSGTVWPAGV